MCKQRLLRYADDDDDFESEAFEGGTPDQLIAADISHIHSMNGDRRSRPLKVVGLIQEKEVCILIDTGSDRDFLHPRIAEKLHLPLAPIRPFRVYVGNGEALLCTHMAKETKLTIQGNEFVVDLYILPIHGPDIILGMDWLESLGKVTADFAGKTLEFTQGSKPVTLRGIVPPPSRVSLQSLSSLISPGGSLECYEILLLDPTPSSPPDAIQADFPQALPPEC